jgi:hypothetical protein
MKASLARLSKLEWFAGRSDCPLALEDLSDDRLAELASSSRVTRASEISDHELELIAAGEGASR